ncbi:MAG: alginate export family protein [Pseudomonadota bacterium]
MKLRKTNAWLALGLTLLLVPHTSDVAHATDADLTRAAKQIRWFRWQERYDYIDDLERPRVGLEHVKHVPIFHPAIRLDVGGQYRLRFEQLDDALFNRTRPDFDFTSVAHRFELHANLRLGSSVRAFFQLGTYFEDGRVPRARAIDASDPDIQQAFLEIRPEGAVWQPVLRAGRQEISFGRSRLLAVREGPNIRRVYDALRLNLMPARGHRLNFFAGRPMALDRRAFKQKADETELIIGSYWQTPWFAPAGGGTDLIYLYREDEAARLAGLRGRDARHTLAARWHGRMPLGAGAFSYDVLGAAQFGTFAAQDVRAWAVIGEAKYQWREIPWEPAIRLQGMVTSGDGDPGDGTLGTFNPLYPNLSYYTRASVFTPTNLSDAGITFEVTPVRGLTFHAGVDLLDRMRREDAVYGPGFSTLVPAGVGEAGAVATLWEAGMRGRLTNAVTWKLDYVHGVPRGSVAELSAARFDYLVGQLQFRF